MISYSDPGAARSSANTVAEPIAADPPPRFDHSGVDLGLIEIALARTPAERLAALQGFVEFVVEARRGVGNPVS